MKLMIHFQINNDIQSQQLASRGGMTAAIRYQIAHTDTQSVVRELLQKNIESDFRNNKLIAWASKKCVDLIELLSQMSGINFGLPKGIFAEDFDTFDCFSKNAYGFCNMAPAKLYRHKDIIVPEKTIFFNAAENNSESKMWKRFSNNNARNKI